MKSSDKYFKTKKNQKEKSKKKKLERKMLLQIMINCVRKKIYSSYEYEIPRVK